MKKFLSLFLTLIFFASLFPARASGLETPLEVPDIISEAAVLMDAETGQVLYQKNHKKQMYPASTTKIMTGLLVAENGSPEEIARVSSSAVDIEEWDSANISLVENEEMSVDSLMYAMMMPSANDAANVLAEHIAGSQYAFTAMMNARAKAIGAESTHFANAHGLHDPNHYTTAYDLALITREAVRNKTFAKYFGTAKQTIPSTNLNPYERPFTNYQYMLVDATDYYEPAVTGGKVGYTHEAEHTMSTIAEKDGRTLICTVMKSPNRGDKFLDTKKLLDFGFGDFALIYVDKGKFPGFEQKITSGEEDIGFVSYESISNFKALVHKSFNVSSIKISYLTLEPGSGLYGEVYAEFYADTETAAIPELLGRQMLESKAVMYQPVEPVSALDRLAALADEKPWIIPFAIFLAISAIFLLFTLANRFSGHIREKRRQERLEQTLAQMRAAEETRYNGPTPVVGKQFLTR